VTNPSNRRVKAAWSASRYVRVFQDALEHYETEHPHWRVEVLVSMIRWGLRSLKHYIEERRDKEITWESPFVELRYAVDWDWKAPRGGDVIRSKLVSGKITKRNTSTAEAARRTLTKIMVRHLTTLALQGFTSGVWYEVYRNYFTPFLPAELAASLNSIRGKRERREAFDQLARPLSIGAATIDYSGMPFRDGARVTKRVARQLSQIDSLIDIPRIGFAGDVNGRKVEMSLIFRICPLVADYDQRQAYLPITVGLFIPPRLAGKDSCPEFDLENAHYISPVLGGGVG
jgi:hypothetical protein